jgi:branched-chain amino acid transport system permease protein
MRSPSGDFSERGLRVMHVLAAQGTGLFIQQIENGIVLGAIYALVALGYTLVYGIIELINFAHGDVFMWGTMVSLTVAQAFGIRDGQVIGGFALIGLLLLMIVLSMVFCAGLNVVIERFAYRPLRTAPRLAPLIAAIGVSFILENIAELWRGANSISFPLQFPIITFSLGPFSLGLLEILIILFSIGLMYALTRFIQGTRLGRAMRATAQDPEAAALMGVNINQTIALTFLIGGALAGAAGVAYSLEIRQVAFNTGFELGLIAFTAAVLGGIGNVTGAVFGGFLIGLIQAITIQYIPNGIEWIDVTVFAILILILVFRPSGLLGQQIPNKA